MPDLSLPTRLGGYRLEKLLGRGGMGEVFLAWDERLERHVALKRILNDPPPDERARSRFRREARAAARLSHPAIVQVFDLFDVEGADCLVMEYVEGHGLAHLIAKGSLDLEQILRLATEIADGLAEAHGKGLVHRDLKPENVCVTTSGRAKILDFGLARLLWHDGKDSDEVVSAATRTGALIGTIHAMSPEQASGRAVDHRSDLFALGGLIYEMLTGRAPFRGTNVLDTLRRVTSEQPLPLDELRPGLPAELTELVAGLLAKEPKERPQNARLVADVLERLRSALAQGDTVEPAEPARAADARRRDVEPDGADVAAWPTGEWPATAASDGSVKIVEGSSAPSAPEPTDEPVPTDPRAKMSAGDEGTVADRDAGTDSVALKTLLLTDLIDSTRLLQKLGDSHASEVFKVHDRLARDLLRRFDGREIDKTDGFLLLFHRPVDAVGYALAYHRALQRLSAEKKIELRARAGIHLGEVFLRQNLSEDVARGAKPLEVEGLAKPLAARLMSLAGGGQTLLTRGAFELARRALVGATEEHGELRWLAHGPYFFKGVRESVDVFEVGAVGVAPLSAPASSDKVQSGRQRRRRASGAVLGLLLAVASWFLGGDLLRSPAEARPAVAVLGLKNLSGDPDKAWLATALSELLRSQLAADGELRLIPGENVARMRQELALPAVDSFARDTLENIEKNLGTDWVVLGSYLAVNEEVSLVLHLQSSEHPENAITLQGEPRPHQQLFALASEVGQKVRRQLRLGDLSTEQVEAVRATLSSSPEATRAYAEGLARLRQWDALAARGRFEAAVAADPEYALAHAALSEAWQALGYDQKAEASASRAFELAKSLSREDFLSIRGQHQKASADWEAAVETYELLWEFFDDNVEYGLQLAEAQLAAGRQGDALATTVQLRGLTSVAASDPRIDLVELRIHSSLAEYEKALGAAERAADKGRAGRAWTLVAEARRGQGWALRQLGRLEEAAVALAEARRLFTQAGDQGSLAQVLYTTGLLARFRGNGDEAEVLLRQALEIHEETGSQKRTSSVLNALALLIQYRGDLRTAKATFERAEQAAREVGSVSREMLFLGNRSVVLLLEGQLAQARLLAQRALSLREQSDNRLTLSWTYFYLGDIVLAAGDLSDAEDFYGRLMEIATESGFKRQLAVSLAGLAAVRYHRGELAAAEEKLVQALSVRADLGEKGTMADMTLLQPELALAQGRVAEAEAHAREAVADFAGEGFVDYRVAATVVLAEVLLAQDRQDAARDVLEQVRKRAEVTQYAQVRWRFAIADARLVAAGGAGSRVASRLDAVAVEAGEQGFVGIELAARLAEGEARLAAGDRVTARGHLLALVEAAEQRGFGLIADRARRLAERTESALR